MKNFIHQANLFAKNAEPFLFYIDFEKQQPKIIPLTDTEKQGIFFSILNETNVSTPKIKNKVKILMKNPIHFSTYEKAFNFVQQELYKGNSYLLNLTFPSEIQLNASLEDIFYQSQAPFKLYVKNQFVCFSPEPFVLIRKNNIYTYPMKGTLKTNKENEEKDYQLLINNEKEKREHFTIVDLMRNDLSIISKKVKVKRFRYIDKININNAIILQTSSEIKGELKVDWRDNIGEIIDTLLPAGSISGAPKKSTLEIIHQAEHHSRGYYSGVFGLFDGENLISAVMIRFIEQKEDQYFFHSGGGITLHSNVEKEYQELIEKVAIPV